MAEAAIAVISALIVFWLKRRIAKDKDVKEIVKDDLHEIDSIIEAGDADSLNDYINHSLQDKSGNNSKRQRD